MKKIDFTFPGGFPVNQENLDWMQQGYNEQIKALIESAGTQPSILAGCVDDGTNISDGWIYYNGEIMPFVGGASSATVYVETIATNVSYWNGATHASKIMKQAKPGTGAVQFNFSDLKPYPFRLFSALTTDWVNVADSNANYSFSINYRRNLITKMVELVGDVTVNDGTYYPATGNPQTRIEETLFSLPGGWRPPKDQDFMGSVSFSNGGEVRMANYTSAAGAVLYPYLNVVVRARATMGLVTVVLMPTTSTEPYTIKINSFIKLY